MATFRVSIDTDNGAFSLGGEDFDEYDPAPALAGMLRDLADRIEYSAPAELVGLLMDVNGNRVGSFGWAE